MLNWEYNADAERRVLTEEAVQQGAEKLAKLIKEGMSLEEALAKVKAEATANTTPS